MKEWSTAKKAVFFGVIIIGMVFMLCLGGAKNKNVEEEEVDKPVYWIANHDLAARMLEENEGYLIVDARSIDDFAAGHLENAMCIPPEVFTDEPIDELPDLEQMIFVYAKNTRNCKAVCEHLAKAGYTQVYYIGAASSWKDKFVL